MLKGPKRFPSLVRGCASLFLFYSFLGTPMSHGVSGRTVAFPARKSPRTLTAVGWTLGTQQALRKYVVSHVSSTLCLDQNVFPTFHRCCFPRGLCAVRPADGHVPADSRVE